jgi:membrane-associated PAP2 superfamily phosphatase
LQPAALAAAALLIWSIFELGGLDRWLTALAFEPALGRFPLRHSWALNALGHDGLKWVMLVFWMVCLAWRPLRRGALYMAFAALVVTLLKQSSPYSCPWDLVDWGGSAVPPGPGRCLPAGHPVTGFMLFGLYFALRHARPRAARAALVSAWVIGLAAGAVQVARGAHFASHVLWTAWVAWAVTLVADALIPRRA